VLDEILSNLENLATRHLEHIRRRYHIALGLDLGLDLGYALAVKKGDNWELLDKGVGTLKLKKKADDLPATIYFRLFKFLDLVNPGVIFYEDIRYTPPAKQGIGRLVRSFKILDSLRTILEIWATERGAALEAINPSKIASVIKEATKSGIAKKEAAINFAKENFGVSGIDHHAADALLCLMVGLES